MLDVTYPTLCRISTFRNLIAVLIVGCFGVLSKATCATQEGYISRKALALSSNTKSSPPYAISIANLAPKADGAYRGSSPSAEGQRLKKLGSLYAEAGLDHEFELSHLRALTAIRKALEAGHFSITSIAKSLGWRYDSQPHYQYAEARIEQFVSATGQGFTSRAVFAWGLSNLAIVYKAQGRSKQAISLLEHALAIAGEADEADSYRLGVIANRVALYCAGEGRAADAEAYFKQAISAFEKSGDLNKASEAGALHNLAIFYGRERRYSEETEAALRSLSLLTEEPTQDQSRVFDVLNTLGGAYYAQGRYKDAEPLLLRAFALAHKEFKSSDPRLSQVSANLAVIYKYEERILEAVVVFTLALEEAEIALGPQDIWVGMIANRLAVTYLEQGKSAEAELLFRRAVAIGQNSSGKGSLFLSGALFNLSALYAMQGRYKEAEALLNRLLTIRLSAYGPSHPAVTEAQNALQAVRSDLQQQSDQKSHIVGKTFPHIRSGNRRRVPAD